MPVTNYISVNGRMLSEVTDGVILDYVPDALGSIHSVVDQTATAVKTMRYKPYGEVLSRSGSISDRMYQWVGTYGYRATFNYASSHYVRARHYSQTPGSWTTVDPLWPYECSHSYVHGRACARIDWLGMSPEDVPYPEWIKGCQPWVPKPDLGSCNSTARGRCPNSNVANDKKGPIKIEGFKPPSGRTFDPSDPAICDPTSIDKNAIIERIRELEKIRDTLCGLGDKGVPGGTYKPIVTTRPCKETLPDGREVTGCAIICEDLAPLDKYFPKKPHLGKGCIVCCLMVHENKHCEQIRNQGAVNQTGNIECEGFNAEIDCLKRVLRGKPCSQS